MANVTGAADSLYGDILRWYADPCKATFIRDRAWQYLRNSKTMGRGGLEYACAVVDALHQRLSSMASENGSILAQSKDDAYSKSFERIKALAANPIDPMTCNQRQRDRMRAEAAKARLLIAVELAARKAPTDRWLMDIVATVGNAIGTASAAGAPDDGAVGSGATGRKPGGWTRKELIDQVKETTAFSAGVFDRIRIAAGVKPGEKGGRGQQRRFSNAELRKLIAAVEAGTFRNKSGIAMAWRELFAE